MSGALFEALRGNVAVPRWLAILAAIQISVTGVAGLYDLVKWTS